MMRICLEELTDLEKAGLVGCGVLALILLVGVIVLIRTGGWKRLVPLKYEKVSVPVPLLLILIVVPFVPVGIAGWWLHKTFPAESFSFSQKTWTLGEIKERVENQSQVRIELQGNAASFGIDRKVSGSCASDLVTSICNLYGAELKCDHNSKSHTFIITLRK
jgi:hypothetical protein